jgi:hypothetical protein
MMRSFAAAQGTCTADAHSLASTSASLRCRA